METMSIVNETLKRITVNPTEMCSRKCPFCPRHDSSVYPNRKLHMSIITARKMSVDMRDIKFTGEFYVTGFGEPLLHPDIGRIFEIVTSINKVKAAVIVTNGDFLTTTTVKRLRDSGVTKIVVSMYDGSHQKDKFKRVIGDVLPYDLRERYYSIGSEKNYGIENINNRSGLVKSRQIEKQYNEVCYLPFNKCQIDWNGDVLLCDQDWGRNGMIGNIHETSIEEVWMSDEMKRYRQNLINSNRSLSPCSKCDVNGKVYGKESFERLRHYYEA